jgi:hypothetical protein
MGLLYQDINLEGIHKTKSIYALLDSGSDINIIRKKLSDDDSIDSIGFHTIKENLIQVELGNNDITKPLDAVVFNSIQFKSQSIKNPIFIVLDNSGEDMILGAPFMQEIGLLLDFVTDKIYLGPK